MRPAPGVFPFIHTVRLLAARHDLVVEICEEWLPGYGADVLVKARSAEVSVSLALLAQPAAVQEFAAAHEIAHVVLRHLFWRRVLPAVAWALTLAVLVFVGLWLAVHHLAAPATPLVLVLGALGLLGAGIGAWAVLASRSRRYENDADQLALAWGYTLTGSHNAYTHGESWLTTSRLYRPFRMHPQTHERADPGGSEGTTGGNDDRDKPDPTSRSR